MSSVIKPGWEFYLPRRYLPGRIQTDFSPAREKKKRKKKQPPHWFEWGQVVHVEGFGEKPQGQPANCSASLYFYQICKILWRPSKYIQVHITGRAPCNLYDVILRPCSCHTESLNDNCVELCDTFSWQDKPVGLFLKLDLRDSSHMNLTDSPLHRFTNKCQPGSFTSRHERVHIKGEPLHKFTGSWAEYIINKVQTIILHSF